MVNNGAKSSIVTEKDFMDSLKLLLKLEDDRPKELTLLLTKKEIELYKDIFNTDEVKIIEKI